MKILLLAGGISDEHDVSMVSGDKVESALKSLGHEVVRADPAAEGFDLAALTTGVDVVFPALHGLGGEDGALQEQLEGLGIACVGSGSAASKLCFNKVDYKRPLADARISTPEWQAVTAEAFKTAPLAQKPFVLKPIEGGSSIDTFVVKDIDHLPSGIPEAFDRHKEMLLEQLIEGQEITVGVLGDTALPVLLIVPPEGGEFDYANKYNGKSQEIVNPSQLSGELQRKARDLAATIHKLVGCRDMSRTDMMIDESGTLYVLETNTIPGLTGESLFPKAAAGAGVDFIDLINRLITAATS